MSQEQQMQVRVNDESLAVKYSNHIQLMHTEEEFILEFLSIFPPQGNLISRIALSPGHVKRLHKALDDQIKAYEQKYSSIKIAEVPDNKIGFKVD
jgi:hypothetical protein